MDRTTLILLALIIALNLYIVKKISMTPTYATVADAPKLEPTKEVSEIKEEINNDN